MYGICIYEVGCIGGKQVICKYIRNMVILNQCPVYTKGERYSKSRRLEEEHYRLIAPLASVQLLVSTSEPTGNQFSSKAQRWGRVK